ncbi:ABC transporter ATP-binding protein [Noviherbaspirillum sedimenti]|uniref:ABC transporter ATP-binding protein n=1 Tax=Noviherbaspirillum sedimenti TaxID=2320865 RepID=A0A3A3G2A9_9BURK|nr:ABC transporter ATP-binding protein [Noviherbaspirillum sedimenti]RJG02628.1 ABC transporter ATP-binding protein [Noviherbaspirillum sedimenti]
MSELKVNDVSVRFGGVKAISDVTLSIFRKEVLGLIGPNGAGKTTLVNCISGFQKPTSGQIQLEGSVVSNWSPALSRKRGIARTFQGGRLFGSMTVLQNVEAAALALGMHRNSARAKACEMLQWAGYTGSLERPAETVAYVDERRIGIARALIGEPSYVLLDEPAAGMSDVECEQLMRLIKEIPEQLGAGVLLIEHNMQLITSVCHRVHVLDGGSTLAEGQPAEVLRNKAVMAAYLGEES